MALNTAIIKPGLISPGFFVFVVLLTHMTGSLVGMDDNNVGIILHKPDAVVGSRA